MILNPCAIKEKETEHLHSGFFVCMIAFAILIASPLYCTAMETHQQNRLPEQQLSPLHLQNYVSKDISYSTFYRKTAQTYLPYGQRIQFSGNIYTARKHTSLPAFASELEYNKRESITDFGMTGIVRWPLMKRENWSININGKVTGSKQYFGTAHPRNRWNFEHQVGWDANYKLRSHLIAAVGIYHYRIIDDTQNDEPAKSYINSGGGFASLRLQF